MGRWGGKMIFDNHVCKLGEGPLWHPQRQEFLWFDILGRSLRSRSGVWDFDEYVSAAGWVSHSEILMATQTGLDLFNLDTGESDRVVDLEADNPVTRSNDGRADPFGGFWIGTMGIGLEPGAGAIYRYYQGEVRRLFDNITVSNAICFAPEGETAYFCDTNTAQIRAVALEPKAGWPVGEPWVAVDLVAEKLRPDGCVIDAAGNFWNAQWGMGRVACYDAKGGFQRAISVGGMQSSCPAFGGEDLTQMIVTTAASGLSAEALAAHPDSGKVFAIDPGVKGQAEHRVIL